MVKMGGIGAAPPAGMLDVVATHCKPYQPPDERWRIGHGAPRVQRLPDDLAAIGADLEAKFAPNSLVAAGVYQPGPDAKPTLTPWFRAGALVHPIRHQPEGPVVDFVGLADCLIWPGSPLGAFSAEIGIVWSRDIRPEVIGVRRLEEVDLLQRFGFNAALVGDVEALDGKRLAGLLGKPGLLEASQLLESCASGDVLGDDDGMPPKTYRKHPRDLEIRLLGWDLLKVTADSPDVIDRCVKRLAELHQRFDYHVDNWRVWRATQEDAERFKDALALHDPKLAAAALQTSIDHSCASIVADDRRLRKFPPSTWEDDLHRAQERLTGRLRGHFVARQSPYLRACMDQYRSALCRGLVDPIRNQAVAALPEQRPLYWHAANLAEKLVDLDPLLRRAMHVWEFGESCVDPPTADQDVLRRQELQHQYQQVLATLARTNRPRQDGTAAAPIQPAARRWSYALPAPPLPGALRI